MNSIVTSFKAEPSNFGLVYWDAGLKSIKLVGDYSNLISTAEANSGLAISLIQDIVSCKVVNVSVFEVLDEIDAVFEYMNTQSAAGFDKGFLMQHEIDHLLKTLTNVRDNLSKLSSFDLTETQVILNSSLNSLNSNSVLLDSYESLGVKINALLELLDGRLDKLNSLDYNVSSVEDSINSSYDFIAVNEAASSLKTNLTTTSGLMTELSGKISTYAGLFCGRVGELTIMLDSIEKNIEKANGLLVREEFIAEGLRGISEHYDNIAWINEAAAVRCAELEEFVRCLQIYESQMIRAGSAVAIEKEDKIFKVHGIAPPQPECPPIIYIPPTTTPSPNYEPKPSPGNPNPTTTTIPTTTTSKAPCSPLTVTKKGADRWFFTHTSSEDSMVRTVGLGGSGDPDIKLDNGNELDVIVKLEVEMELTADEAGRFQILIDTLPLTAYEINGSSASGVLAAISPQYIRLAGGGTSQTTQNCIAKFKFDLKSKTSANLFLKGSLPGSDSKGNDKWFVKSLKLDVVNADGVSCNSEELSETTSAKVDDYLDSREWTCSASWVVGSTFIKEVQKDQTWARADGKPRYNSNAYTTGSNNMSVIKLVLCRFDYDTTDNNRVFHKFLYTNEDFDNPFGVDFHKQDTEVIADWVKFAPKYRSMTTTNWRVMRQICETGFYTP